MNTPSNAIAESPLASPVGAPVALSATRPLYWSLRREMWENRSVYIAPLIVAAVVLFGLVIAAIRLAPGAPRFSTMDPARQSDLLAAAYGAAAIPITLTVLIVGVFYCLGALHNERRDRSILFWKSLPVSDLVTVLSKASIPLAVLPLVSFAIIVATRLIMLLLGTAVLLVDGQSAAALWARPPWLQMSLIPLYGASVLALWHAPIYGWLLLVSGWARRAPFLWAFLPPLALCVFEKIAFNTSYFASMLGYRVSGSDAAAFAVNAPGKDIVYRLAQLDPVKFLESPDLWIGLAVAAAFLAAAVWQRRYRQPL
jgi:ABC-2 type transport system permease protein